MIQPAHERKHSLPIIERPQVKRTKGRENQENLQVFLDKRKREKEKETSPIPRLPKIVKRLTETIIPSAAKYLATETKEIAKVNSEALHVCEFSCGVASSVCQRPYMEDFFLLDKAVLSDKQEIPVFAVMDGHGGDRTAKALKAHFIQVLTYQLNHFAWTQANDEQMHDFWKKFCDELETLIEKELIAKQCRSGSTLTCGIILKNILWVLNVGDSRTTLSANGMPFQLSEDANFTDEKFLKSIKKRAGVVKKDNHQQDRLWGMAMTRAFGDLHCRGKLVHFDKQWHTGLIHHPKIKKFDLTGLSPKDEAFLLLGSDGFWDFTGSEEAAKKVCTFDHPQKTAEALLTENSKRGCQDNATLVVVKLSKDDDIESIDSEPTGSQHTPPASATIPLPDDE